jgi:hypothetical protein
VTQQDIDAASPVFTIEAGDREQFQNRLFDFISENGYAVVTGEE